MTSAKRSLLAAAALAVVLAPGPADAGILGTYTFTAADPGGDGDTPNLNGSAATQLTYTTFSRNGINSTSNTGTFASTGYTTSTTIVTTGEYSEFSVSAAAGYALELTDISFTHFRDGGNGAGAGPRQGAVRSSFESYAAGSGSGSTFAPANNTTTSANWNFNDYVSASAGSATFRFYGWDGGSNGNGQFRLDNVQLNGDVVALARMQASATPDPAGPVIVGAAADVDVSVQNTASGGTKQQGLNYTASGNGDLSGGGSNPNLAPGPADVVTLSIDTSTAGARGGTVTVSSNAYSTNGNVGQSTFNQVVSVNVLDHSNASFDGGSDDDEITVDFGTVLQGSTQSIAQSLHNLESTASFTAGLDLDTVGETDVDNVFSTNLSPASPFVNMVAGGSQGFLLDLDTSQIGSYSGSYLLTLSDEDLPGATGGQTLTINLLGNVVAVPEPATLGLLIVGAGGLLLRRRREV